MKQCVMMCNVILMCNIVLSLTDCTADLDVILAVRHLLARGDVVL